MLGFLEFISALPGVILGTYKWPTKSKTDGPIKCNMVISGFFVGAVEKFQRQILFLMFGHRIFQVLHTSAEELPKGQGQGKQH